MPCFKTPSRSGLAAIPGRFTGRNHRGPGCLVAGMFLILGLLAGSSGSLHARVTPQVIEPCNIAFYLPAGFQIVEETKTSLLARDIQGLELAVFCTYNENRTNRSSEILARPGVQEIKQLHMESSVTGILFSNTRFSQGKKLQSIEAYLATRNLEYRVIAIPPEGSFETLEPRARTVVEELLAGLSWIAPPESTISEEQYQQRLWLLGLVILAILGLVGLYLWKRKKG
ncbi:MAG TPA: hypothetical protein DEA96_16730 [Leptospiraceae bacterium]|nr:hypothetical protein [Spirochaetaceae bacterium]HBS06617.1 hypothetical protein [Leptospiraceae bacterium]